MNNYYNTIRLALILALQAEVEGMKAENVSREQQQLSIAYTEDAFQKKADAIRELAYKPDDLL